MWQPGNNPSDGLESTHLEELFSSGNQDWLDQWQPISIDWIQQDAQWVDLSNRPAYQQQKTSRSKKTGTTLDAEKVRDSALQTTDNCLEIQKGKESLVKKWINLMIHNPKEL
ncbi:hypothetical protein PCANC_02789 [Puccinia coronata f. sp. avenae]|uniref:Uncharacterized protein n=1 Tax=Puccinia coronata f. sp. avenae TaxID=200324 RepID=A0A2N5W433_9BASI|nr:hypothetical protein PCANC_02789 [Puccinia coronata f. sp. avenae]